MLSTDEIEREIRNREAFDAVFGGWSSFRDGLLLSVRPDADPARVALARVEAEFELPGGYAEGPDGYFRPTSLYRVLLRFHDAARIGIDEFLPRNIVMELRLEPSRAVDAAQRPVAVTVEGSPDLGGDLSWVCAAVEVAAVTGPIPPAA